MSVFDGLADIFADTFGEPVVYTPKATGIPKTIHAIWIEHPIEVDFENSGADSRRIELSVRSEDVADPAEDDTAKRESDGKIMKVSTPIQPDGKGMIVCALVLPGQED